MRTGLEGCETFSQTWVNDDTYTVYNINKSWQFFLESYSCILCECTFSSILKIWLINRNILNAWSVLKSHWFFNLIKPTVSYLFDM